VKSGIDIWNMSLAEQRAHRPEGTVASGVGVLDRSMAILDAVERGARSFTQIVEATGLARSTAHRLVKALEDHGMLARAGGLHGYRLGPRLLGLAATAMRDLPLRDLAHPALERLASASGESAQLYVRDADHRVCVDAIESSNELRTIVAVGASLPLTKGSAGKVFLAWAPPHDRDRILQTLPEPEAIRLARHVATTRRRGWADSVGEREPGVASVSAPVLDREGLLVAAISVSGPANRIGIVGGKRYAPAVTAAAAEVADAIGA
jgi:DNA-binding IclR family transcriptional regulator